jgi:p-aminobenzoyl-glutamate transporter AbgT
MAYIITNWRWFAALGVVAAFLGVYQYGKIVERQLLAVESAQNDGKAIQNRSKSDEDVLRDGPSGWCIELGGLLDDCSR